MELKTETKRVTVLYIGNNKDNLTHYLENINGLNDLLLESKLNYEVVNSKSFNLHEGLISEVFDKNGVLKNKTDILVINGGDSTSNIEIINKNLGKGVAIVVPTANYSGLNDVIKQKGIEGVSVIDDFAQSSNFNDWKKAFEEAVKNVDSQKANKENPSLKVDSHVSSCFIGQIRNFIKMVTSNIQNIGKGKTQ
jgi:hypothetical protein